MSISILLAVRKNSWSFLAILKEYGMSLDDYLTEGVWASPSLIQGLPHSKMTALAWQLYKNLTSKRMELLYSMLDVFIISNKKNKFRPKTIRKVTRRNVGGCITYALESQLVSRAVPLVLKCSSWFVVAICCSVIFFKKLTYILPNHCKHLRILKTNGPEIFYLSWKYLIQWVRNGT